MGPLAAGSVVLIHFPFSDLSQAKLRPAVVLADCGRGDWLLCQITSKPYSDFCAIKLMDADFRAGGLRTVSFARPAKLFTAHQNLIVSQVGELKVEALQEIRAAVVRLVQN